jgi:hypothetical protein
MRALDSSPQVPGDYIEVDLAQLRKLAIDLQVLARTIQDRNSILHNGLPAPELAEELRRAEGDWSAHRRSLCHFLDSAAAAARRAAEEYQQAERAIFRAGRGTG